MNRSSGPSLGIDVGAECVKAVLLDADGKILGRATAPTQGYFEACVEQVRRAALEEGQVSIHDVASVVATGFGARCVDDATATVSSSRAHAVGAFVHHPSAMNLVDIGGREVRVVAVDDRGRPIGSRGGRKCVAGIGSFLIFASRHLDVHPTRMQELAATAKEPATVSSFCSVFSSNELLERLRDGASREDVALGCMRAIAERILELGIDESSVVVTGGVAEYFPGVLDQLKQMTAIEITVCPDPIYVGAHGAALSGLHEMEDVAQ